MPNTKLLLTLCVALLLSPVVRAQYKTEDLLKLKPEKIKKFNHIFNPNTVELTMEFNSPEILNPRNAEVLKGKAILKVELYYTNFQMAESFSQPALNKERFDALKKLCPYLFKQSMIEWKIIGQNGSKNVADAKDYFHGFIITYIPTPDKEAILAETKSISSVIKNDSLGHDTEIVTVEFRYKKTKKRTGLYMPLSKRKREDGVRYSKKGIWNRKPEYVTKVDTIIHKKKRKEFIKSKTAITFMRRMPDSTIFKVLERHPKWNNILFICDVTGSMSPYTTEVLVWHKLNYLTHKAKYFTFFNDGDETPDSKKKMGKTGGIYSISAGNYEAVEISLLKTMEKGGGGDAPENNCEAVIKSLQEMNDAEEVIMIADNWANVKDLALAEKIKKPVRIILCGAESGFINVDYLELARKTKGSIHIMNEDLENLIKLSEGQVFSFGKKLFRISGGKIISHNPA